MKDYSRVIKYLNREMKTLTRWKNSKSMADLIDIKKTEDFIREIQSAIKVLRGNI